MLYIFMGSEPSPLNSASVISVVLSMKLNLINDSKIEYIFINTPQQMAKCTNTLTNTGVQVGDCG